MLNLLKTIGKGFLIAVGILLLPALLVMLAILFNIGKYLALGLMILAAPVLLGIVIGYLLKN